MENYVGRYFNSMCYLLNFPINLTLFLKSLLIKKKRKEKKVQSKDGKTLTWNRSKG